MTCMDQDNFERLQCCSSRFIAHAFRVMTYISSTTSQKINRFLYLCMNTGPVISDRAGSYRKNEYIREMTHERYLLFKPYRIAKLEILLSLRHRAINQPQKA